MQPWLSRAFSVPVAAYRKCRLARDDSEAAQDGRELAPKRPDALALPECQSIESLTSRLGYSSSARPGSPVCEMLTVAGDRGRLAKLLGTNSILLWGHLEMARPKGQPPAKALLSREGNRVVPATELSQQQGPQGR